MSPRADSGAASRTKEAEHRILDAAAELFLQQGYGRTTMDQVVTRARTSKTTLYGRFPHKADLFAAVIHRSCEAVAANLVTSSPSGDRRERLVQTGTELALTALTPEVIALMRVTAAEAGTFPDLAREGFDIGFGIHVRCIAHALAGATTSDAEAGDAQQIAVRFVELALHPLFMHAIFGADLDQVRHRARGDVERVAGTLVGLRRDDG